MFKEALTQIVQKLEDAKKGGLLRGYGLIGGLALAAGGVTRATEDIDFAVAAGSDDMPKLASALGGQYRPGGGDDPLLGVINAVAAAGTATIPVQLVLLPYRWTEVLLAQVRVVPVHGCSVPVISWQALILLKLYPAGPRILSMRRTCGPCANLTLRLFAKWNRWQARLACPASSRRSSSALRHKDLGMALGRVLIVDDEADVRRMVKMDLTKAGFDVIEAEDGEKAMKVVHSGDNPSTLDAIICDLATPKVGGMDAIAYFRSKFPLVPVIVLSDTESGDKARLFKQGIVDFMVKPIVSEKLTASVAKSMFKVPGPNDPKLTELIIRGQGKR